MHEERDQLTRIIRSHASVCPLTPRHSPLTVVRESPLLVVPLRESPIITGQGRASSCTVDGGCEGLALIRESPLTTGETLAASIRESPLPSGTRLGESPLTIGVEQPITDSIQSHASTSGGREKGSGGTIVKDSARLLRESPLLAALASLSSASASVSSQSTGGVVQSGSLTETKDLVLDSGTSRGNKNTSKSPVMGMTSGMSSFSLQSPVILGGGGNEAADGGSSGRSSRNGRRSSLLMQSPVMGGARPSVVMHSPALLVPPTRESPVPLLIINPNGGTPGGAAIGPGIGQITNTGNATMTSPLPPSGRVVPSSPVPMSSRPRKSPIALFRGNPSPVHSQQQHLCNPIEQRLAMDQSPVLFGSPPKQSKHSIPPRLNLSGPKPVKPILPKPPSSSISSASSSGSSSSFPCSSPRTPQSFIASPLPTTASPVSATGRPSHASPVFFGEGCFTPSVGKGSSFLNAGEYGIRHSSKSPLFQVDEVSTASKSPLCGSDKLRQSPMQRSDSLQHTNHSPLCILEAMRQINQSPMRKPDVKRKLNQSPLCATETAKQHIRQSPISQMDIMNQTNKSPAGCVANSPARAEHSPMTVSENSSKRSPISSSRITQQSPVFFGSGKGSNPPPSANRGQFLQPQPLPRSVAAHSKSPASSLLTLLQRGNSQSIGVNRGTGPTSSGDTLVSSNVSNAFANPRTNHLFHSNRGSGVFSTTPNNNAALDNSNTESAQSTIGVASDGKVFNANSSTSTRNSKENNILARMSSSSPNVQISHDHTSSNNHEIIDVDELDEAFNRTKNKIFTGSKENDTLGNFCFVNNTSDNGNNNSNNVISLDSNKAQDTGSGIETFTSGSNVFASTFGFFNKNESNTATDMISNDVDMNKNYSSNASTIPEHTNAFTAARMLPDSPALPSPSIMLDDNALSLEEIERSAAVLEGRDDFMDLLDIQALLELSADHNSGNSNTNFSSCDNYVSPNNTSVSDEGDVSRNGNLRGLSSVRGNNAQNANTPGPGFNVCQRAMPTENSSEDVNTSNNPFVQNATLPVYNSQSIPQANVTNSDSNFLFNTQSHSMQTDGDRYAQILASFRSLQNISQNSTSVMNEHLQCPTGTQQSVSAVQGTGEVSAAHVAQSALSNLGSSGNLFVSSATSTIHHHPSQTQHSSFLIPSQGQENFFGCANSTLITSAMGNEQKIMAPPQIYAQGHSDGNPRMSNQDSCFILGNQNVTSSFQIRNQQNLPQSVLSHDKHSFSMPWQSPVSRPTGTFVAGPIQGPDQRREIASSYTSDGSLQNIQTQAPSGFSTYRSRLRELLNAPTTPDVTSGSNRGGPTLCNPTNNTSPFTPAPTQQSVWESQTQSLTTSSGLNMVQRLESEPTPEVNTNLGQSSFWEPPSAGSQTQMDGKEHSEKHMRRE